MARVSQIAAILALLLLVGSTGYAAVPYSASFPLGSLTGQDIQLVMSLYENSGSIGNAWALIDNVRLGTAVDDFEDGTLGGFSSSLNPASVSTVAGSLDGTGNYVMRMGADPLLWPTIVYRNYFNPDGDVLTFDFQMFGSSTAGFWGPDTLVVSLLDPYTLEPVLPGLTGTGDILAVDFQGVQYIDGITVTVIPAPGALLLTMLGAGLIRLRRIR